MVSRDLVRLTLLRSAATLISYFSTGVMGLALFHSAASTSITLFWIPSGVAMAAFLLWGRSMAAAVWLGAFLVNVSAGDSSLLTAAIIAVGNTGEAFVATALLLHARPRVLDEPISPPHLAYVVLAFAAGCIVAAIIGPLALLTDNQLDVSHLREAVATWFSGDLLGALFFTPLIVAVLQTTNIRVDIAPPETVQKTVERPAPRQSILRGDSLRPLEWIYLIVGIGIILHGSIDHQLTIPELGAALFFIGLVPVSRADRRSMDSPGGFIRKAIIAWLTKETPK